MARANGERVAHPTLDAACARARMRAPARTACAAAVALGSSLAGGTAVAEPPRDAFRGAGLWFGTSNRPSGCRDSCGRLWGAALEGSVGRMIGESLAIRGELWIYSSGMGYPAAGLMAGVQWWPGARVSVRAALGGAVYLTSNADGPDGGLGGAAAITGSYELWRSGTASGDLELRGMLLAIEYVELVPIVLAGYAIRWD